jgi:hypothetical protein
MMDFVLMMDMAFILDYLANTIYQRYVADFIKE